MNEAILNEIDRFIADNEEQLFLDIARLVAVNSVEAPAEPDAPFGRGSKEALELGLNIADELGLNTRNCENKIGYASIGESEKYLATITHLDVVPTGDGWSHDPFTMRTRENYIIGRGVMDDKGPSVLCLYALKYLKEHKVPLRYEVRALLGTNEETGMGDVDYYLENYPAPAFCFSPDANFPLCNGEKGICGGLIKATQPCEKLLDIRGGFVTNAIPDKCEAWVKAESLDSTEDVDAVEENGVWHLTSHGIGGHASMPEGTKNAIGVMAHYLIDRKLVSASEEAYLTLLNRMHDAPDGSLLGVDAKDDFFTPLTIIGGVLTVENGRMQQSYDCRFPTTTSAEQVADGLRAAAGEVAEILPRRGTPPFYMSLDNPAVQVCVDAYNAVTGENAKPYTIGGGTYARHFPNAVSFGPEHPERSCPEWAGPIHGIDEAACKDWFLEALKVYIVTLIELQKLDF